MELVITEKPQAALKIAQALADGKAIKESIDGVPYYKVTHGKADLLIGCAVGHLFGLDQKDGKKSDWPVFNIEWKPTSELSKSASFSKKYVTALKKLAKEATVFTVATDYDIEGEVIGLNVVRYICKKTDARRMKFSTLTTDELRSAYQNASPHLDWGQANAGETRHMLDFYWGINLSRALTYSIKQAGAFKLMSTGRVQGPALKLIVEREREISAFKPTPYWQIQLDAKKDSEIIESWHKEDKFLDQTKADTIYTNIRNETSVKVASIDAKQFSQNPPPPFDLTSLQIEAHRTIGISPKNTLAAAQKLYLAGLISYPRTSSQKLPASIGYTKILGILAKSQAYGALAKSILAKPSITPAEGEKSDPAHPSIYPTGNEPKSISAEESKLYDLIVHRFLAVFGEPAIRETVTVTLDCKNEPFIARGTVTKKKGWHTLYGKYAMFKELELPLLTKGETLVVQKIQLHAKETLPPKRYTDSSIIKELEKQNLGTKATRAQIIDTLASRHYIEGKSITATELGIKTIETLEKYSPKILDQKLTRHFENEMEKIREQKKKEDSVLLEARTILTQILGIFREQSKSIGEHLKDAHRSTQDELTTIGACPTCKEGTLKLRKGKFGLFIACAAYPACRTTFSVPKGALIKPSKNPCAVCTFPSVLLIRKAKKPQDMCINAACPSKKSDLDEKKEHGSCPKCKEGKLIVRKSLYGSFLGCNTYPKCKYTQREASGPGNS